MSREQQGLVPSADPNTRLPAIVERVSYFQAPQQEQEAESAGVPISHYFWMLSRHKWHLLAFVATAVAVTIFVSMRLTPYYQSTATLDVDRMAPSGIIGQEATSRISNTDSDTFMATQIRLIQSDSVLRPVL
ncbi:MAG: transport protein, partial [Bryobacterales bacterium]|nr:transport protein [Bryobacterales bacterium]